MVEFLIEKLHDPKFMASVLAAIAEVATAITLALPLLARDELNKRLKAVALEREKMRQRESERMARGEKVQLRQSPQAVHEAHRRPVQPDQMGRAGAGARQAGRPAIAAMRAVRGLPVLPHGGADRAFVITAFYLFVVLKTDQPPMIKLGMSLFAAFVGMQLPFIFLKNQIQKRQPSVRRAFPDALDLLLICVESGMSIEAAFRKVSQEIGSQSIPLAEELTLTTAELSYLQDRKVAYENLAKRTDLEGGKSGLRRAAAVRALRHAARQTLRVMAQENRDMRMSEAEKRQPCCRPSSPCR